MRHLAWTTLVATFLLMVWGTTVSATGSGLACPDWPLCHGRLIPPLDFAVLLEWGHRVLAAVTSALIVATIVGVLWRSRRDASELRRAARTLIAILVLQIVMGGVTVLLGLSVIASTLHLLMANLIFAGLIVAAFATSGFLPTHDDPDPNARRLRFWATGTALGLLVQLALGAMVRHGHAGLACPGIPGCTAESFLPAPWIFETAVAFLHRWWGCALLVGFAMIARLAARAAPRARAWALAALGLAAAQVALGAWTVLGVLATELRVAHAAVGYLLWGALFGMALHAGGFRFLWATDRSRSVGPASAPPPARGLPA